MGRASESSTSLCSPTLSRSNLTHSLAHTSQSLAHTPSFTHTHSPTLTYPHTHSPTLTYPPTQLLAHVLTRAQTQFARAYSLIGAKAQTMDDAVAAARTVQHLHAEARLHVEYCASFGVSEAAMEAAGEDSACTAYTRYVLDIGHSHDLLALLVAMAPCLFGYADIGAWLLRDPATRHHAANPYYRWILTYGCSPTYAAAVDAGRALLERKARAAANARLPELIGIFLQATRLECDFWAMGLRGPP